MSTATYTAPKPVKPPKTKTAQEVCNTIEQVLELAHRLTRDSASNIGTELQGFKQTWQNSGPAGAFGASGMSRPGISATTAQAKLAPIVTRVCEQLAKLQAITTQRRDELLAPLALLETLDSPEAQIAEVDAQIAELEAKRKGLQAGTAELESVR